MARLPSESKDNRRSFDSSAAADRGDLRSG